MTRQEPPGHNKTVQSGTRRLVFVVFIFSIFTNLLMLTGPLFMLQVYDRVLGSRSEETLVALFGLVAGLYFFYWLIELARGRVAARVGARIQSTFDERAFRIVLEDAAVRHTGLRSAPLAALNSVRAFFTAPVFLSLMDLPWTPVFIGCIFIFHPLLGWLAAAGGTILIITTILNQLLTRRKVADANRLGAAADRFAKQSEEASELIWAQGMGSAVSARWQRLRDESIGRTILASDWTGSFSSLTKAFRLFLQSAILALGAWLVLENQITGGVMIAASILMGRALAPVEQSIGQWTLVQNARSGWRTIKDAFEKVPDRKPPMELPRPKANLSVENVTLSLNRGDKPILRQVSFSVGPGEALGIIGKSGSGKTTLARVIVGLVSPTFGEVRLNGATLEQYGPEALGQYIGYLPQNVQLFDGTIAENISQLSSLPDAEKVVAAAQRARVHEIILGLPKGYETPIESGDAQLSGGQKQRLALARALYNNPELLVLDEPNSALDSDGSEALNEVVAAMKSEGKAVLIMTHRPTAISSCDKLLVIDKGAVAAYGARDDVIKSMMSNAGDVSRAISRQKSNG